MISYLTMSEPVSKFEIPVIVVRVKSSARISSESQCFRKRTGPGLRLTTTATTKRGARGEVVVVVGRGTIVGIIVGDGDTELLVRDCSTVFGRVGAGCSGSKL
jgi:hypothetical protein